jgi:hypothetical protein
MVGPLGRGVERLLAPSHDSYRQGCKAVYLPLLLINRASICDGTCYLLLLGQGTARKVNGQEGDNGILAAISP